MMKSLLKLAIIIAVVCTLSVFAVAAETELFDDSEYVVAPDIVAGDVYYTLDDDGTLTIYSKTGYFNFEVSSTYEKYCSMINRIVLSDTITTIGEQAFDVRRSDWEDKEMKIFISSTVETIEGYVFNGCNKVVIELDSNNKNFKLKDGILYTHDMMELVYAPSSLTGDFVVPSHVTTVRDGAFAKSNFTSVTIPNTVTSMISKYYLEDWGEWATMGRIFANAHCKRISIGKNVEYLGSCCFYECEELEELYIYGFETEVEDGFIMRSAGDVYIKKNSVIDKHFQEYSYYIGNDFDELKYIKTKVGDISSDDEVDVNDAILLLQHSMFPELYPLDYAGNADFTGDGVIDMNDAILLLQHSMFPELYPIN